MTLTLDTRAELLGACRLFAGVGRTDLAALADRAVEVQFPADRVIARQGEIGTGFFVVFGALPKTSTGKIQKFVLRERARALPAP